METFALYIMTAFSLIFVIEGLVYTLFPDFVRKMMAMAVMMPVPRLRLFGIVMTATGLCLIGLMRILL
ncbi:MAG: DUF2065 domain-containing protein [Proteobacteria bacterium]|nr:DUF2065 domain-containing protein [Pseudomonadota bacterium]